MLAAFPSTRSRMSGSVSVVIIRHGERLDEADMDAWRRMWTEENQYDPPLTREGWEQAACAGQKLLGVLQSGATAAPAVSAVYSSPTMRTMATAAAVAQELGVASVSPAYGLNCCAAAKEEGVASKYFDRRPSEGIMNGVALAYWPPIGDAHQVDLRNSQRRGFVDSVQELAAMHSAGDVIVLVTHREGLWEILRHVSGRLEKTGYCCTRYFKYDIEKREVDSCTATEAGGKQPTVALRAHEAASPRSPCNRGARAVASPQRPQRLPMESPLPFAALEAEPARRLQGRPGSDGGPQPCKLQAASLSELLEGGVGAVRIDRRGRGGSRGTLLWQTPGVRGAWVENSCVPDGEVAQLLSPPQSSEGGEGDFVLVRLQTGVVGWTKVKNIALPSVPPPVRSDSIFHTTA